MTFVKMNNILNFSSNYGVILHKGALEVSPKKLHAAVKLAFGHLDDEILLDACLGGQGPLADVLEISYEEYLKAIKQYEIEKVNRKTTQEIKRKHIKIRRAFFNSCRAKTVLSMIDAGKPYVCAYPGCNINTSLTIDHIVPLSRGGSDELSNLQFLCFKHNSSKGNKIIN